MFVQQTDLQSLRTPSNSKIQCACGKEVNSHAGLNRHQRSSRVIMGLNDELSYALQEDNEEIFGYEYRILREDEVNDFKIKYRNHAKNQLKQTLKKLKSDKTVENPSEIRYVSKLLRSRIQNNQSKTNESSSLDGIDHDFKIKNHFWNYAKLIFEKPAMVFPSFDENACYQFFKNCFSRSKISRFNIPAWMPQYDNLKKSLNIQPPSYRDIRKVISKMKAGAAAISDVSYSKALEGSKHRVCSENGSYQFNLQK